jgi:hypothetical protein
MPEGEGMTAEVLDVCVASGRVKRQISIYIVCAGVFLLAFAVRLGLMLVTKSYLSHEYSEIVLVAMSLAQGRGFANAFGNTGPTAHMSPVYPFLLSLLYRRFGTGIRGEIAQEVVSCFFASLTWALIPLLGEICQLDRRVGITAAVIGAVLTINHWVESKGSSEAALAGLACVLVFMLFMKRWYSQDFSARAAFYTGVLCGLCVLVTASLASIIAGLLLSGYLIFSLASSPLRRSLGRNYLRFCFIVVALIVVTLFPWALRNYRVLGGFVWTRSDFPLEVWVSNNNYAGPNMKHNEQVGYRYHPSMSAEQRAMIRSMGELPYQRMVRGEVMLWIKSHPGRFIWLTLQRIFYFWFPEMKRPVQTLALALITLASIPGLIFLLMRKQLLGYGLLTVMLTYPLVYYIVESHPRYVYPIQWTLYLLAAQSIVLAYDRWMPVRHAAATPVHAR